VKHKVKRVHVGIGGAGMSGIAEVLLTQDIAVTDLAHGAATALTSSGARRFGHAEANMAGADVVVVSTQCRRTTPRSPRRGTGHSGRRALMLAGRCG
jgi:UDP-N-acetylmuramate--alanine ligase